MIPNIVKGTRPGGLMVYLAGPGRRNEHEEPHIVAGSPDIVALYGAEELDRNSALEVGKLINDPHTDFGVDGPGGQHVWHCSLSVSVRDGVLSDQQWQDIADDFMKAMDLDDPDSPKSPVEWAAVRHGFSANGNDHIHIVASLIRDDGTKASVHNDYRRAQDSCRALEVKHGLEPLESKSAERSTRGYKAGELEAEAVRKAKGQHWYRREKQGVSLPEWEQLPGSQRRALIEKQLSEVRKNPQRLDLARTVRAAATASKTEDEFVRRLRRSNLIVRPRYAAGTTDVVTGYSVAQRVPKGETPIRYGGQSLGNDLTLSRLRKDHGWSTTPQSASKAAAEWNSAARNQRPVHTGRETQAPTPDDWQRQNVQLRQLHEQLRRVPVDDHHTWSTVARQTSGALAAWSRATEAQPGDLARAADALSLSAQTKKPGVPARDVAGSTISDAAMLLAVASKGGQGTVAEAIMLRQLMRLSQSVYQAAKENNQLQLAQRLETDVKARLISVRDRLPTPPASTPTRPDAAQTAQPRSATATLPPQAAEADPTEEQRAMLERMRVSQGTGAQEAVRRDPLPPQRQPKATPEKSTPGRNNDRDR